MSSNVRVTYKVSALQHQKLSLVNMKLLRYICHYNKQALYHLSIHKMILIL